MSPLDRYPTGVLHPVELDATGIDPASTAGDEAESNLHDEPDEDEEATHSGPESDAPALARPVRRRRYVPPSSVGFSCYVRGHVRLSITAAAAVYRGTEERGERGRFQAREYTRSELPETTVTWAGTAVASETGETLWGGRAGIDVRARPHRDGCVLTVTLCNRNELDPNAPASPHPGPSASPIGATRSAAACGAADRVAIAAPIPAGPAPSTTTSTARSDVADAIMSLLPGRRTRRACRPRPA